MRAEIITIGDELLIGQVVDTNSAWMAERLNEAGIELYQIPSVHDDPKHIVQALDDAFAHADIVLTTGGLGPTKDDITKKVMCDYFHTRLIADPSVELLTLAVPNDVHKELAIRGLAAGKNVISEKPVTLCSADLEEMIDTEETVVPEETEESYYFAITDKGGFKVGSLSLEKDTGEVYLFDRDNVLISSVKKN